MDHSELLKELSQIEKLTNQERLKLAHNRRKVQLKCWNQYEKLINNSSLSNNKKKGNLQQQKFLEQLQIQSEEKKARSKLKKGVKFRNSIMLLEAAGRNDIAEVRRLLYDGVDPNVANEDGLTALHQCCIDNNEEMLKLLLDSGANVNAEDSEKWTPLHAAATCGHLHLVKILIAKGANLLSVNAEGNMPYDICDEESTLDYIESQMAQRGVTQELIETIRALPETRMLEDMEQLEASDGDLEARDPDGATYLHIASANGYVRVVEFLLDHHVATDVQDKDCWQPIHAAACWGHIDVLELLVQNGADLNARTKNNETPQDICEDADMKERICELRSEQEIKLRESGSVKRLRRSVSSNSRTQSIRRTSQRDKSQASKRDTADEAAMLLHLGEETLSSTSPSPTIPQGGGLHELILNEEEISATNTTILLLNNKTDELFQNETSLSSEEEFRSLPPWSQGRDSVTQLHLDTLPLRPNSIKKPPKELIVTNGLSNGNNEPNQAAALARLSSVIGGVESSNNSVLVSNPSLRVDSNANLPQPDITTSVGYEPKINKVSSNSGDKRDSLENGLIDIRVQVTINTNRTTNNTNNVNGTPHSVHSHSTPTALHHLHSTNGQLFSTNNYLGNNHMVQPGTLAELKKQRSLNYLSISRNSTFPMPPGLNILDLPPKYEPPPSPSMSLKKYSGNSADVVGDYSQSQKKCCTII